MIFIHGRQNWASRRRTPREKINDCADEAPNEVNSEAGERDENREFRRNCGKIAQQFLEKFFAETQTTETDGQ